MKCVVYANFRKRGNGYDDIGGKEQISKLRSMGVTLERFREHMISDDTHLWCRASAIHPASVGAVGPRFLQPRFGGILGQSLGGGKLRIVCDGVGRQRAVTVGGESNVLASSVSGRYHLSSFACPSFRHECKCLEHNTRDKPGAPVEDRL